MQLRYQRALDKQSGMPKQHQIGGATRHGWLKRGMATAVLSSSLAFGCSPNFAARNIQQPTDINVEKAKHAAEEGKERTISIATLGKQLGDRDFDIREAAAQALGEAAQNGTDISGAIGALGNALLDGYSGIQRPAAVALVFATSNEKCRKTARMFLMKALADRDAYVRRSAARALGKAAQDGTDISVFVAALGKQLRDDDFYVRRCATDTLVIAAQNGTDISAFLGTFGELLVNKVVIVQLSAALAFGKAARDGTDIKAAVWALGKALSDGNASVNEAANDALREAALDGSDISVFVETCGKLLGDRRKGWGASYAMGYATANEKSRDTVFKYLAKALGDNDAETRINAIGALAIAAQDGTDISVFVGTLGKLLGDNDARVRSFAAQALWNAAQNGVDISAYVGALGKMLRHKEEFWASAGALVSAAANEKSRDAALLFLRKALVDRDADVRGWAAYFLGKAAEDGIDISVAIGEIGNLLGDSDYYVRWEATVVFSKIVGKEKFRDSSLLFLMIALIDQNPEVRVVARWALKELIPAI